MGEVLHWENQYREWDMETISYFGAGAVQVKSILSKKFNLEDVNQLIVKSATKGNEEIIKVLLPLTHNPNTPLGRPTSAWVGPLLPPISMATINGHANIVKLLAHLVDAPNVIPNSNETNIYWAAFLGHTEIIKILAPLTQNPNAPCIGSETPSKIAANIEIARILRSYD